jgi:NADH-quinone oxidoreductase subunit N
MAAVENGNNFWVVIVAVLFAAVSTYYYFRVIQAMYFKEPGNLPLTRETELTGSFKAMLLITAILIIVIGIYPEILVGWMYH